jgi:hypothetical protein
MDLLSGESKLHRLCEPSGLVLGDDVEHGLQIGTEEEGSQ